MYILFFNASFIVHIEGQAMNIIALYFNRKKFYLEHFDFDIMATRRIMNRSDSGLRAFY